MKSNALQELINAHCRETGETISDIAARGGMSRQTVSALAHRATPGAIPRRTTLARLALGLGLSLRVVEHAAAMAASSTTSDMAELRLDVLTDAARGLTDKQLRALVATARALSEA